MPNLSHSPQFRFPPGRLLALAVFFLAAAPLHAAIYHVDPAIGSMANPGTASAPWSTLEAVFAANKTFTAGDEIVLRSGYHGAPTVKGTNSGNVTIRPDSGASPKIRNLIVKSGARWVIAALDICPENAGPGVTYTGLPLVEIESSASHVTLRDCLVRSAFSIAGWVRADWDARATRGIRTAGPSTTLSNNRVEAATHALTVRKTAPFTLVTGNTIKAFSHDGMQVLADDTTVEYNTVTDAYISDSSHNHDDFFQSWSADGAGTVGAGTIYRVTVRGNVFISRTSASQPLAADPQGIGCFDGYFEDWVIENNIIASKISNGISFNGAINCKVVNNTVVENPLDPSGGSTRPYINFSAHKTRATPSTGNLARNNISSKAVTSVAGSATVDHHQTTTAYTTYFTNYPAFDFSLKPAAPAVGMGEAAGAPAIDILEVARSVPYDLGAHEYVSSTLTAYQQWLQANGLPVNGSGNGAPDASPRGDGVTNEMKFALGLPVTAPRYGGRVTTGKARVSNKDYLSLTYIRPEPVPAGATYAVKTAANLGIWSTTQTVQVSSTSAGGLRTIVVRDTVPIGEGEPRRFIRLEADAP